MSANAEVARRTLELMDAALESVHGIEIEADKVAVFRRNFYREKQRNLERYEGLGLLTPPKDGGSKVWIVYNDQLQGHANGKTDL